VLLVLVLALVLLVMHAPEFCHWYFKPAHLLAKLGAGSQWRFAGVSIRNDERVVEASRVVVGWWKQSFALVEPKQNRDGSVDDWRALHNPPGGIPG
jgi:hypothetical protein